MSSLLLSSDLSYRVERQGKEMTKTCCLGHSCLLPTLRHLPRTLVYYFDCCPVSDRDLSCSQCTSRFVVQSRYRTIRPNERALWNLCSSPVYDFPAYGFLLPKRDPTQCIAVGSLCLVFSLPPKKTGINVGSNESGDEIVRSILQWFRATL